MMRRGSSGSVAARIALAAFAGALSIGVAGCWPWHHSEPTPQEQYLHALSSGQSAQASQIWLNMSPEDRIKWDTSQGVQPSASPEEIKSQVMKHYQEQMGEQNGDQDENIETVSPDLGGGGLDALPKLATPPPQSPPPDSN
jgi:hypothetical protein